MPCPPVASRKASTKSSVRDEAMWPGSTPRSSQHVVFGGVGGGKHLSTEVAGDLDGGLTDTSGAGVDEHPLPGRQPGDLDQGDIGGQKRHRHGGGLVNDHPAGMATTMRSSVIAVGANALCGKRPITASPGRSDVTSGAVSMTTPAASPPRPSSAMAPNATTTSRKFSPAART